MRVTPPAATTSSSSLYLFSNIFTYSECCNLNSSSIPFVFKSKLKSHTLSLKTKTKTKTKTIHRYPSFSIISSTTFDTSQLTQDEEHEGDTEIESQSGEYSKLYVGNLPYAMSSSQLAHVFAEAGNVVTAQNVYDNFTDRSRGFGFVTMSSVEEAKNAIRMFDGCQVGGRTVRVTFPEVPKGGEMMIRRRGDSPYKLYAGNLSWSLTSKALREAFVDQPGLLSADVISDPGTGTSRGFGFITFSSAEQVESALDSIHGVELEGRPLRLKLAWRRD